MWFSDYKNNLILQFTYSQQWIYPEKVTKFLGVS